MRIVITGSTRGIGYGLADSLLALGASVVVSGRTKAASDAAAAKLAVRHGAGKDGADTVWGQPCDVADLAQDQALWDAAVAHMGGVDVWICNAGISTPQRPFWEHPASDVDAVVRTNLVGAMYGAQVALRGMVAQGSGQIYLMEGFGSSGEMAPGMGLYGSTKAALRYLAAALKADAASTPVLVGTISPGMVITDMVLDQYAGQPERWERARRIWNILGDRVEDVTPYLAQRIIANRRNGARIAWLGPARIAWRFLMARIRPRDRVGSSLRVKG
jgi:NAD(P)-dependent dehydrogenase (short-subunit alcohol dehydrogenase family)